MGVKASKLTRVVSSRSLKLLKCPSSLMTSRGYIQVALGVNDERLKQGPSSFLTPRGYIPVAVGVDDETTERFMVHTTALSNKEFVEFLCRSAEEYGFYNEGILRIPYDAKAFEEWIMSTSSKQKIFRIQTTIT